METISLEEAYKRSIEDELYALDKIREPDEEGYFTSFLAKVNEIYFLYAFFEEKEYQRSKNYLYKAAMAEAYYIEIYKRNAYEVLNIFTFPVLSDSSEAIERYLNYPYSGMEFHPQSFGTLFGQAIQASLRNDNIKLEELAVGIAKRSKHGSAKNYAGAAIAFQGLAMNDKQQIEEGIYAILKTHKKQTPNRIDSKYINYKATAIAKLAYRRGIEVVIDNPLVPKELLPIQELNVYERYDFFDELK